MAEALLRRAWRGGLRRPQRRHATRRASTRGRRGSSTEVGIDASWARSKSVDEYLGPAVRLRHHRLRPGPAGLPGLSRVRRNRSTGATRTRPRRPAPTTSRWPSTGDVFTQLGERIRQFIPLALRHRAETNVTPRIRLTGYAPHGTMELYLLRHAHAGDPAAWDGPDAAGPSPRRASARRIAWAATSRASGSRRTRSSPPPRSARPRTAELVALHLAVPVGVDDRLGGDLGPRAARGAPATTRATRRSRSSSVTTRTSASSSRCSSGRCGSRCARAPSRGSTLDLPLRPAGGILRWLVPPDLVLDR